MLLIYLSYMQDQSWALVHNRRRLPYVPCCSRYLSHLRALRTAPNIFGTYCSGCLDIVKYDRGSSGQKSLLLPVYIPYTPNPVPSLTRGCAILAPQKL